MKSSSRAGSGIAIVLLAACAQAAAGDRLPAVPSATEVRAGTGEVPREIIDPATGNCWLLERQSDHPGGPARLLLAGKVDRSTTGPARPELKIAPHAKIPMIRAGDAVILAAHTAIMDAQLEAIALTPAPAGTRFRVRIRIGGEIVEAVALGPGRAEWARDNGVQP